MNKYKYHETNCFENFLTPNFSRKWKINFKEKIDYYFCFKRR